MLVKFEEDEKKSVKTIPEIDIDEISIEAGKMEAQTEKEKYVPTEEDLIKLKEQLELIQKEKFGDPQPPLSEEFEPYVSNEENEYIPTDEEEEELKKIMIEIDEPEENPNAPKINRLSYLRRDG
jgi:hypothetical protein